MVEFLRLYAAKVDAALGLDKHDSLEAQRAGNLGCHGRHYRHARHQPNRRGPHASAGLGASAAGSAGMLRGALRTLWKEEGPKSLLKGVQPRIMATVPSSIMIVTVYEFVKEWSVRK
jgi:hypothetical protein